MKRTAIIGLKLSEDNARGAEPSISNGSGASTADNLHTYKGAKPSINKPNDVIG
jgi:hypothetical protein